MFVVGRSDNKSLDEPEEADPDPKGKRARFERKRAKGNKEKKSAHELREVDGGRGTEKERTIEEQARNGGIRSTCILLPCLLQRGLERLRVSGGRFRGTGSLDGAGVRRAVRGKREKKKYVSLGCPRCAKIRIYECGVRRRVRCASIVYTSRTCYAD